MLLKLSGVYFLYSSRFLWPVSIPTQSLFSLLVLVLSPASNLETPASLFLYDLYYFRTSHSDERLYGASTPPEC